MLKRFSITYALASTIAFILVFSPVHGQLRSDHSSGLNAEIKRVALSFSGICELTGHNDGPAIEAIIRSVGAKKGAPYCAAFCDTVLRAAGVKITPGSAWSPSFFPKARRIMYNRITIGNQEPDVGDIGGYFFQNLKRIGHVGIKIGSFGDFHDMVEANTSNALTGEGLRNGGCILNKKVQKRRLYAFARWKDQ
jgi:hypothetical protein